MEHSIGSTAVWSTRKADFMIQVRFDVGIVFLDSIPKVGIVVSTVPDISNTNSNMDIYSGI